MRVDTRSMKKACEILLNHLEQSNGSEVEISQDYYWHIPAEQWHNMGQPPADLTVGQLTDDWQELERIVSGKSEPVGYAMVWLASVMRALGESSRR